MAMPGFLDDGIKMARDAMSKNLHSNDAINKIGKDGLPAGFLGGIPGSVINHRKGDTMTQAIKNAHQTKEGNWNYGAIAGSAMVAGIGARVASGGGVYRDANGNTDVAGIPFI